MAHVPAIAASPSFHLAAVATSRMETARASAERLGVDLAFDDPAALAAHPAVDVVAVCVRVPEHARLVGAALDAGKHVYCEWPLARDAAEAQALVAAAHKANVVHLVGLQARLAPQVLEMKARIAAGEIGTIISASLSMSGKWASAVSAGNAYLQTAESGGNYFTIAAGHALDAFCDVAGTFETISAATAIQVREIGVEGASPIARTAPDHLAVAGRLASGAFGSFVVRGTPHGGSGLRFEVNGDRGALLITTAGINPMMQMSALTLHQIGADGQLTPVEPSAACYLADRSVPAHAYGVAQSYAYLADAIRGKGAVPADFDHALAHHRLLDRIKQAAAG